MTMSTTYAESTLPLALQTVRPSPMRRWWAGRRLTLEHRIEIYRYLARELRLGAQLIEAVAGLFWIYSDEGQRIRHPIAVATRSWLPRQIGRAHVCTPVTNAHLVCRLLLEKINSLTITTTKL